MFDVLPNGLTIGVARLISTGALLYADPYKTAFERVRQLYEFPPGWIVTEEDAAAICDRFVQLMPYLDTDTACSLHNYLVHSHPAYRAWCVAHEPEREAIRIAAE